MGLFKNWKDKKDLEVNIHVLMVGNSDLAKTIIENSSNWRSRAKSSIANGEKIGDVAAFVILEHVIDALSQNERAADQLRNEFTTNADFETLSGGNQAISYMLSIITMMQESKTDKERFSPSLAYIVINRYSQSLGRSQSECEQIRIAMVNYAKTALSTLRESYHGIKQVNLGKTDGSFSLADEHLAVIQTKIGGFIEQKYQQRALNLFDDLKRRIEEIDPHSPDAHVQMDRITASIKSEILAVNNWAWDQLKIILDADYEHFNSVFPNNEAKWREYGELIADKAEADIDVVSQWLIQETAAVRNKKLAEM